MPTQVAELKLEEARALSDEQIVERVLRGELVLFELLMRRNNARIYRAVRSLIRDEAEVEDVMQAAYVLAYAQLKRFKGNSKCSTWLTQVALNEALGRLRRDRRHPAVSLSLVE
ncbi:MAG: sigma factor, partial [Myxococcaceae bacterium]